MCNSDGHAAARHSIEKQRWAVLRFDHDKPCLELLRSVSDKSGPMLGARNNLMQVAHHLAAVAYAQGKGISTRKKSLKLIAGPRIEQDRIGPAFPCAEHIAIRKPPACGEAFVIPEGYTSVDDIAHMHVNDGKSCAIESGCHFHVTVHALFAQHRYFWFRPCLNERCTDVLIHIKGEFRMQAGIMQIENAVILLLRAFRIVAE